MPAERTTERLKRILVLIPWVIAHPDSTVAAVCERFDMTREQLMADLDTLFMCGLPPFGPGDLIEAFLEGDRVVIRMADYLTKPPRLTHPEALALLVMGRAVAALPGFEEAASLNSALGKLAGAVSPSEAQRAHDLVDRITVELASAGDDLLAGLRNAVDRHERLRMTYYSGGREEMTEREVDPLLVCASMGSWYLIAHDHHSGEERTFRIDRIRDVAATGETFERSADFDPERYTEGPFFTPSARDLAVTIDLDPGAKWIREVVPFEREVELDDGRARIELRTPHLAWVVRLLLSAGEAARPVEPPDLADAVREAARRALALYEP